jgi:hypothetical protein
MVLVDAPHERAADVKEVWTLGQVGGRRAGLPALSNAVRWTQYQSAVRVLARCQRGTDAGWQVSTPAAGLAAPSARS